MEPGDIVAAADVVTDEGLSRDGKEVETKLVTAVGDLSSKPSETIEQVITEAIDLGRLLESIETQALSVKELVEVLRAIEESRAADDHRLKEAEIQLKGAHLQAVTGRMDRERLVWEEERRERQRDRAWAQLGWFNRARYALMGKGRGSLELGTASSYSSCACCVTARNDNHAKAVVRGVKDLATSASATSVISSSPGLVARTASTTVSSALVEKPATLDGAPLTTAITTSASAAKEKEEGKEGEDEEQVASLRQESKPVEGFRRGKRSVRFAIWRRK